MAELAGGPGAFSIRFDDPKVCAVLVREAGAGRYVERPLGQLDAGSAFPAYAARFANGGCSYSVERIGRWNVVNKKLGTLLSLLNAEEADSLGTVFDSSATSDPWMEVYPYSPERFAAKKEQLDHEKSRTPSFCRCHVNRLELKGSWFWVASSWTGNCTALCGGYEAPLLCPNNHVWDDVPYPFLPASVALIPTAITVAILRRRRHPDQGE